MYDCVIFDVDGTLIDTESAVFACYQKVVFDEFQRNFLPEELKAAYGVPTNETLVHLGFKDVKKAEEKYYRHLLDEYANVKPFNGVPELLDMLERKGIVTGIVTSRDRREVENDTCLQVMIKYFNHVVCADDTTKHKPNPEPLLKLIEKANCSASKALYIGDTHYDYLCAKSAGVDFALALWGAKNIEDIHAKYNLEKPEAILEII